MPDDSANTGVEAPREPGKPDEVRAGARMYLTLVSVFAVVSGMAGYHYAVRGPARYPAEDRFVVPAADPGRGRALVQAYGCAGCHVVPGVPGAEGRVGPRLDRLREQAYVAGVLPNSPQNLATWIQRPRDVDPLTAMPNLGVGEADARDMAAYLYSIR